MVLSKQARRKAAAYLYAIRQTKTSECIDVNGPGYHYDLSTGECVED
jgi:hypothetical protein